ncbi:MAG: hypothetical protein AAF639_31325 [Chloroflexota bacterium]
MTIQHRLIHHQHRANCTRQPRLHCTQAAAADAMKAAKPIPCRQ